MNISYKQSQMELFPGKDSASQEAQKPKFLLTHITLTLENLVIFGILAIMITVFTFSLGVERGKHVALSGDVEPEQVVAVKKEPIKKQLAAPIAPEPVAEKPLELVIPVNIEPPVEPKAEPIPDNAYTIQVASFKQAEHAREEAKLLEQKGFDIFVVPKGEYSIVCVGKFQQRNEAQSFARKLKDKYKDYLIRRL